MNGQLIKQEQLTEILGQERGQWIKIAQAPAFLSQPEIKPAAARDLTEFENNAVGYNGATKGLAFNPFLLRFLLKAHQDLCRPHKEASERLFPPG